MFYEQPKCFYHCYIMNKKMNENVVCENSVINISKDPKYP